MSTNGNESARTLLSRIPAVRRPCDLDLLVFFAKHPRTLMASEQLARLLGYELIEIAQSLEALLASKVLRVPLTLRRRLDQNAHPGPAPEHRRQAIAGGRDASLHDLAVLHDDPNLAFLLMKVNGTTFHGWSSPYASRAHSPMWSASYHFAAETSRFILSTGAVPDITGGCAIVKSTKEGVTPLDETAWAWAARLVRVGDLDGVAQQIGEHRENRRGMKRKGDDSGTIAVVRRLCSRQREGIRVNRQQASERDEQHHRLRPVEDGDATTLPANVTHGFEIVDVIETRALAVSPRTKPGKFTIGPHGLATRDILVTTPPSGVRRSGG